jgi:flagellar biosynthesis/type III secretory pathway protein FliH
MARIIRGSGAVVPAEVVDARAEAERILEGARAEAERIVDEAREAAAGLTAEAEATGRDLAETRAATLLVTAARTRDEALAAAESEIATLGLLAARHIVGEELVLAPERVEVIVREVLERARRAQHVSIRIHPEDAAGIAAAFPGATVLSDENMTRGGCVITTDLGQLDARLEVRLSALRKSLGL